ncbi:MAG: glutaredoxin family protein [Actinomycetota bacterium]
MSEVVLYGKPGCCLCDDAKAALDGAGIGFREVDITSDPGLMAEFGVIIPVVEVDGVAAFEAGMNPQDLPDLVAEACRRG